jgi:ABC-type sugar transport system substrate-binding protein
MKSVKVLLGLVLITTLIVACGTKAPESSGMAATMAPVKASGKVLVGFSAPGLVGGQERLVNMINEAVTAKGWTLVVTNSGGNPQKQNEDIDSLIAMGVKAIIANVDDSAAFCVGAKKALAAGIGVFTADRAPSGCAITMTVQSDNRMAGRQAGEVMIDSLTKKYGEPKGKVLEITGNLAQNVGQMRRDGFHDAVDKYTNVKVIQKVGDWDAAKGQQILRDVLNSDPDLDGIYLHSEVVYGAGVEAVLKELGKWHKVGDAGHIIITGVDGGPWLLQKICDGYGEGIGSQPSSYFAQIVEFVDKFLAGETLKEGKYEVAGALWSPATIIKNADGGLELNLGTLKVTADNIHDPKTWSYWNADLVIPDVCKK